MELYGTETGYLVYFLNLILERLKDETRPKYIELTCMKLEDLKYTSKIHTKYVLIRDIHFLNYFVFKDTMTV